MLLDVSRQSSNEILLEGMYRVGFALYTSALLCRHIGNCPEQNVGAALHVTSNFASDLPATLTF